MDTARIARQLQISRRTVQRLIIDQIFPSTDELVWSDDLEGECEERHRLHSQGRDADWERYSELLCDAAYDADKLVKRALRACSGEDELKEASKAVQRVFSRLRFMIACREESQPLRALLLRLAKLDEDNCMGALFEKACDILGAAHGLKAEQVLAQLRESAISGTAKLDITDP